MRGFPLLNALLVAAAFLVTWWPLRQLATSSGEANPEAFEAHAHEGQEGFDRGDGEPENLATEALEIRIFASAPIQHLRIEHLGKPLADESAVTDGWERVIDTVVIPPEGIEFWVEAEFAEGRTEGRVALGIEVTPGERDSITRTLWTEGTTVADRVVFVWEEE